MVISKKKLLTLVVLVVIIAAVFLVFKIAGTKPITQNLVLPTGFKIETYIDNLNSPRAIEFDAKGRMLVSETKAGNVLVIEGQKKSILLGDLRSPHGLAFYTDPKTKITYLYIAETHQVNRYVYDVDQGKITGKGENIAKLSEGGEHFMHSIAFGPNYRNNPIIRGSSINTLAEIKLYISVGSSCDVCIEDTWKRAAILESDPEGNYLAEFAGGLRDAEFFTFNPITKEIWATETSRSSLGNGLPPDEVNIIKGPDQLDQFGAKRYGWPFCYGDKIKDTSFNPGKYTRTDLMEDCSKTAAPVIELPAHSAPLGLIFIPSTSKFPSDWQGDLLIAYHGSSVDGDAVGYKLVRFKQDSTGNYKYAGDLVSGWAENDKILGQPVDLKFGPDGALYISDDFSEVVYRISPFK